MSQAPGYQRGEVEAGKYLGKDLEEGMEEKHPRILAEKFLTSKKGV